MSDLSHPLNPIAGALSGAAADSDGAALWPAPLEGGYPAWAHRDGGLPCIVESRIGRRYGGQLTALDLGGQVALLRSNRGPQVVTLRFDQLRSLTLGERLSPRDPAAPRPATRPLTLGNARGVQLQCEALSPLTMGGGVFVYQPVDASAQLQCSFHPGLQVLSAEPPTAPEAADTLPAALMLLPESAPVPAPVGSADRTADDLPATPATGAARTDLTGDADVDPGVEAGAGAGAARAATADADSGARADPGAADQAKDAASRRRTVVAPLAALVERAAQAERAPSSAGTAALGAPVPGASSVIAARPSDTPARPADPQPAVGEPATTGPLAERPAVGRGGPSERPPAIASQEAGARRPSGREPTLTEVLPAHTLPSPLTTSLTTGLPAALGSTPPSPRRTTPDAATPDAAATNGPATAAAPAATTTPAAPAAAHHTPRHATHAHPTHSAASGTKPPTPPLAAAEAAVAATRAAIDHLLAEAPTLPMSFDLGPVGVDVAIGQDRAAAAAPDTPPPTATAAAHRPMDTAGSQAARETSGPAAAADRSKPTRGAGTPEATPPSDTTATVDGPHTPRPQTPLPELAPTEPAELSSVPHDATLPMPLDERPDIRARREERWTLREPAEARPGPATPPVPASPADAAALRLPRLDADLQLSLTELGATDTPQAAPAAPAAEPPCSGPQMPGADALPTVQDLATLHARLDAPSAPAMRLGEALMALGALSEAQLGDALQAQARGPGLALGELLLRQGLIDRGTLRTALTCKLGYVAVDLHTLAPQAEALQALAAAHCRQHRALPLCWHGDALVVALDDPSARIVVDRLEQLAQAPVRAVACDADALDEALERLPAGSGAGTTAAAVEDVAAGPAARAPRMSRPDPAADIDEGRPALAALDPDAEDLLADRLIAAALDAQAEDLHIHCETQGVALQLRQGGALRPWHSLPAAAAAPLMRRLHQLAGIDEPRPATPATHGRIALARCLPGQRGEARLQTLRRADGGRDGVLRLPAAAPRSGLAALGLSPAMQDELRQALGRPGGLLLRVGAAGSGRRTAVRAMLAELASPHRRMWQGLAEDPDTPPERAGLRQVRLRPQQGWSAESALKALAHADADVVAIEGLDAPSDLLAALHLARSTPTRVLGTLGAADALDALARLQAAGAPGWALADGLRGLWSTRLLPRCCPACRQARPAGPEWEQALLRLWSEDATRGEPGADIQLRRWRAEHGRDGQLLQWDAPGCARCEGRGTAGWVGVHELLLPGAGLRQALREGQSAGSWWTVARADGWQPLRRDLLLKLLSGQLGADALHAWG